MRRVLLIAILIGHSLLSVAMVANPIGDPLRIAVAGVTHGHLGVVASQLKFGDIQVVGVLESDPRYIHNNSLADMLPDNVFFSDLGKMLDSTRPEAVVAYGSTKDHLAVVEACAPRGIHVMVEKPLATTMKDALRMADLARKHGILLLTNYETTWYPSNHFVKAQVEAGRIGDVFRIEVYDGHQGPVEIGCSKMFLEWLTDPVLDGGGAVMDFGCYGANLSTWILGGRKPSSVYAVLRTNKPSVYPKVDDDATIVLDYKGTTVEINASWCWPYNRKDMFVYGHDGLLYQADSKRVEGTAKGDWTEVPEMKAPYDNPYHYLKAAVRGEITVDPGDLSSLENNLIVVEILTAALRSAAIGKPVRIK